MPEWIVKPAYQKPTPNRYGAHYKSEKVQPVEAIIYHFTVSETATGTIRWLCNADSGVSADFVIGRNGTIYQLAPLKDRTWHAGGSTSLLYGEGNVNGRTKGIELVNWGPLMRNDRGYWTRGRHSKKIPVEDVYQTAEPKLLTEYDEPGHFQFWQRFPPAQIHATAWLTQYLTTVYPDAELLGHEDVDPSRKIDPGPAFPWSVILKSVDASHGYLPPRGAA